MSILVNNSFKNSWNINVFPFVIVEKRKTFTLKLCSILFYKGLDFFWCVEQCKIKESLFFCCSIVTVNYTNCVDTEG